MSFVKSFSYHFQSYRHDVTEKAHQYACGLMQAGTRKNMDRMEEVVPDSKSRNLQQFLTHSKWDARSVIDHVACEADGLIGDPVHSGLLIDESGIAKQGSMSVGVSRQWLGRLGKVDIEELLSRFLPRRDVSKSEIIRQLECRHRKRLSAIKSHTRTSEKMPQKNSDG